MSDRNEDYEKQDNYYESDSDLEYDADTDFYEELPYDISYGISKVQIGDYMDFDRLTYNFAFKKQGVDYILSKMPSGSGDYIAGWQEMLEMMAENISDSPLEEMKKLSIDNIYDGENMHISE